MPDQEDLSGPGAGEYARALAAEGEYWDNFIARRLLEQDEIPGSVDFRIFFTQFSYKHNWGPPCLGPLAINFREREISYVLREATRRPGMRVLDLGCGAGWLSLELARQGAHVTAMDVSRTNLALGRYMVETNARNFPFLYQKFAGLSCELSRFGSVAYVYGDLNSATLPTGEFDAVVVWDALHHVRDLDRLLEQVRATLKPGGVFVGVDHAYATPLTIAFNQTMVPLISYFNSWITAADPQWLYDLVIDKARRQDWGVLSVDCNTAPITGFEAFEAQVRDEMLAIIREGRRQEATNDAPQSPEQQREKLGENESPFEDVSAQRLTQRLFEEFKAEQFRTICPLIMPEQYFPPPRCEPERVFQHYVSAALVQICEVAVAGRQADGQWFLFHLTPERPPLTSRGAQRAVRDEPPAVPAEAARLLESLLPVASNPGKVNELLAYVSSLETELAAQASTSKSQQAYAERLESELDRKNAALAGLESRLQALEAELKSARAPRLPWKRGGHPQE